jgi:hypothetical protein
MALKVVPSMQYGHRMTVGILKRLGFGRLAALLKCKLGSVALVVHGVSLFINLAIFQLAGLATNPALRLGSGRHHLANLHGKRDGDYHRRQRLTVRRPTKSPGEKLERNRDRVFGCGFRRSRSESEGPVGRIRRNRAEAGARRAARRKFPSIMALTGTCRLSPLTAD